MRVENTRTAVAAIEALLNRAVGTPRQSIDLDVVAQPAPAVFTPAVTLEEATRQYLALKDGRDP
jgi:hypothetical protein